MYNLFDIPVDVTPKNKKLDIKTHVVLSEICHSITKYIDIQLLVRQKIKVCPTLPRKVSRALQYLVL